MRRVRMVSCPALLAFSPASELGHEQCAFQGNHGSIVPFGPPIVRARGAARERRGKDRSRRDCSASGWCRAQRYVHYLWQLSWVTTNARFGATTAVWSRSALGRCVSGGHSTRPKLHRPLQAQLPIAASAAAAGATGNLPQWTSITAGK